MIGLLAMLVWLSRLPTWMAAAAGVLGLAGWVAMLIDSWRPGRMTLPLGGVFLGLIAIKMFLPVGSFLGKAYVVPTEGMAPTLVGRSHGTSDYVMTSRLAYLLSKPKRGDLVVFDTQNIPLIAQGASGESAPYVLRLVGLPGEKIEIRDGRLYADGRLLYERDGIPALDYVQAGNFIVDVSGQPGVYQVPAGHYFMLGDNSTNSFDSRYWGSLPAEEVYGRVSRVYYPFSRARIPQ